MSLCGILKLTGWILLLFVSLPVHVFTIQWGRGIFLPKDTKAHINHLYDSPYLQRLINDPKYQELYLTVVFRHFRGDFEQKHIGGWNCSHWPMVLQALNLLPAYYYVTKNEDKFKLRIFWHTWLPNLAAEPIPDYGRTAVRVPLILESVFDGDVKYRTNTRIVRYSHLVEEMQRFVNSLRNNRDVQHLTANTGKRLTFQAVYWLTVIDQFIGTVQQMRRKDGTAPPRSPFPPTQLVLIREPNQVPQQAGPRVGLMAQPGPSGTNPIRRGPSAAAGAPSRGTKRKATDQGGPSFQGGGKRGPGGSMRSMDGASKEPQVGIQAQQSNSGRSCTAMSWISVIMMTIVMSLISFV